jgi:hypothetical protein
MHEPMHHWSVGSFRFSSSSSLTSVRAWRRKASLFLMTLTATRAPDRMSVAETTCPKEPLPMLSSTRYRPPSTSPVVTWYSSCLLAARAARAFFAS